MVYLSAVFAVALAATSVNGVPLTKRIAQVIADSTTKWEAACDKAGGGEKCNPVAVAAFGTLLAAPGPCEQQDAADNMINLAKTLKNDPEMIKFAQLFAQQPRNSPTSQSVPYCQQAPKNSELNGLFQCQFQGDDPKTFVGGAKVGSSGTIPFGVSSPVSPAGSCKANPGGPIKDGSQLTDVTSDPGVSGASGASNTSSAKGSSSSSSSKKKASASASSNDKTATATGASSSGKSSKNFKGDKSSSDCSDDSTSKPTGHSSKAVAAAVATSTSPTVIKLNNPSKSSVSGSASASNSSPIILLNSGSSSTSAAATATGASSGKSSKSHKGDKSSSDCSDDSTSKPTGHSSKAAAAAVATSTSPTVIKLNNPSKPSVSGSASASNSSPIILLNSGSSSTSAAAASGTASSGGFKLQNGKDAQKLNAKFSKLTTSSSCNEGDQACVNKGFAQCVGGKFQVTQCTASTTCVALPLVNSKGTSIACTTQSDAEARIKASGATGGLTGSGA